MRAASVDRKTTVSCAEATEAFATTKPTVALSASFLAWVAGGEPPLHRADRAIRALRVMDALYNSARNGDAPMPLTVS